LAPASFLAHGRNIPLLIEVLQGDGNVHVGLIRGLLALVLQLAWATSNCANHLLSVCVNRLAAVKLAGLKSTKLAGFEIHKAFKYAQMVGFQTNKPKSTTVTVNCDFFGKDNNNK
jgi:hypothetical protein